MKRLLILTAFIILTFGIELNAQKPATIDVLSMKITYDSQFPEPVTSLVTVDPMLVETVYTGRGGPGLAVAACEPCHLPNQFASSFGNFGFRWSSNIDNVVGFNIKKIVSDEIILYPMTPRKPEFFTVTGNTTIIGNIEVRDASGIIAADDEVELTGSFTARFRNENHLDGRKVTLKEIVYTVQKAVEE